MLRPVKITVLVDRDPWEQDEESVKQEIEEIIHFIGKIFEKEFGLTFALDSIKPWNFPSENGEVNTDIATSNIQQTIDYEKSNILLGFTNKKLYNCINLNQEEMLLQLSLLLNGMRDKIRCVTEKRHYANGIAETPGKVALTEFNKFIALHEVAHLFGAEHFYDDESIMNPVVGENKTFDVANKEIIKKRIREKFSIQRAP